MNWILIACALIGLAAWVLAVRTLRLVREAQAEAEVWWELAHAQTMIAERATRDWQARVEEWSA